MELVETDIGRFLLFAGADLVSDSLRRRGEWEPATLDVARRLLEADGRRGGVVVDCGANVGAFTIPVARMLPSTGMVVSFEVQRAVYHQLCGAVVLNRLSNVIVHNVGLAAGPGRASVPVPDYHSDRNIGGVSLDPDVRRLRGGSGLGAPTDHGAVVLQEVELRPLDAFELGDVRLLKIDVEGMELSVLRGAVSTLERSGWPPVLFELWDIGALPAFAESQRELLRFVSGLGYEVQRVGDLGVAQHAGRAMKLDLGPEGARPV